MINSTITNNHSDLGASVSVGSWSTVNIHNSIIAGNTPYQVMFWTDSNLGPATINISNSLIEGGPGEIYGASPGDVLNWLSGNLVTDPLFDLEDTPYSLLENSPCINAGSQHLPNGIPIPEFDLAGNPRISGGQIDMGCYEYDENINEENTISPVLGYNLKCYPNPISVGGSSSRSSRITIAFDTYEDSKIKVDLYNIKGQKVINLFDCFSKQGKFKLYWNGKDTEDQPVSSGQYFIKMQIGNDIVAKKMVMVK